MVATVAYTQGTGLSKSCSLVCARGAYGTSGTIGGSSLMDTYGPVGGDTTEILDVSQSYINGAILNAASTIGLGSVLELNPSTDVSFSYQFAGVNTVDVKAGNTHANGALTGVTGQAVAYGDGDTYSLTGGWFVANTWTPGSGTVSGYIQGLNLVSYKNGTGNVNDVEGQFILTGNANATGTVTTNEGIWIASPYHVGTIGTNTGIKIDDQNVGTTSYTIDANASTAPSRFGGPITMASFMKITPQASPPSSPTEGMVYTDTSHAICYYDGSAWQKMAGAGTCS